MSSAGGCLKPGHRFILIQGATAANTAQKYKKKNTIEDKKISGTNDFKNGTSSNFPVFRSIAWYQCKTSNMNGYKQLKTGKQGNTVQNIPLLKLKLEKQYFSYFYSELLSVLISDTQYCVVIGM